MKNYAFLQNRFIVNTYINRGMTFVRGEGMYLYDEKGERYLDLMSNYGVNIFGYNHPNITESLQNQLHKLTNLHGSFANDMRGEAARELVTRCGGGLAQVYFSNSGTEAIEAALKFAVLATGKKKFIAAKHGYHGKTLGALSATHGNKYKKAFMPLLWHFASIDFDDPAQLETAIDEETAAFIIEPIQGEGGVYVPREDYLKNVRRICDTRGILLILDEIQTGCGRTGTFLASYGSEIQYDIVCLGKGLAGGIPVGATLVTKVIADAIPKHIHTSTFGGNPLATAGIVTTLELLTTAMLDHVRESGTYFISQLQAIAAPGIVDVRGNGLLVGIELREKRDGVLQALQKNHILAIPSGENVVRFLPPFIIEKKQIDQTIKTLEQILRQF